MNALDLKGGFTASGCAVTLCDVREDPTIALPHTRTETEISIVLQLAIVWAELRTPGFPVLAALGSVEPLGCLF